MLQIASEERAAAYAARLAGRSKAANSRERENSGANGHGRTHGHDH